MTRDRFGSRAGRIAVATCGVALLGALMAFPSFAPTAAQAAGPGAAASKEVPAGTTNAVATKPAPATAPASAPSSSIASASPAARRLVQGVLARRDHGQRPFAVIDKPAARLYVMAPDGRLLGEAPVLLGLARGDHTVPGIGDRPIPQVKPHERTTPAGRFVSAPGRNADGARVVWVDYDAAVSMHAVIAGEPGERRFERITSSDPKRRRISFGCVNVPTAFFEQTVLPSFASKGGIVYVLPDREPLESVFPGLVSPA